MNATAPPVAPAPSEVGDPGRPAGLPRSHVRFGDIGAVATVGPRTRKLRAALTTIGIAFGIAAIVAVLGIAESSRADLLAQLDELGTNRLEIRPGQSITGTAAALPDTASNRVRRLAPIDQAAAITTVTATVRRSEVIPTTNTGGISVAAADTNLPDTTAATISAGRWHDTASITLPTVVLGATAAERLGITEPDGRAVLIGDTYFTVIGVLNPIPLFATLDSFTFIGYPVAVDRFATQAAPTTIYVTADPDIIDDIRRLLPATVNPIAPEQVAVSNPSDALAAKQVVDSTLTALLLGLGGVALLVGGIGIANIMVIGVLERRTEIGVRRALGATKGHIRTQFLLEASILGTVGGITGAALGTAVTYGYSIGRDITFAMPPNALLLAIGAAVTIGAIAGLSPAARAARLAPADAIRPT
jgi:putative ABC transport system permease protein